MTSEHGFVELIFIVKHMSAFSVVCLFALRYPKTYMINTDPGSKSEQGFKVFHGAVFTRVSKVIRICQVIGSKKFPPNFHPIRNKTRTKCVTRSFMFSRALHQLHVFALSVSWFNGLPASFVIGLSDYFGFDSY